MQFQSTRDSALRVSSSEAIVRGLAPKSGLFVPESFPKADLENWKSLPYPALAEQVLKRFLTDYSADFLHSATAATYGEAFGETVVGIVRSVEDYGVFIEIAPNLAGLAEADRSLHPRHAVSVYIKNILPEKMKIKLVVVNKNLAQPLRFEPHYFVTRGRIKKWTYSTPQSRKQIETVF